MQITASPAIELAHPNNSSKTKPHNLYVNFMLASLYSGLRLIKFYSNPQCREANLKLAYYGLCGIVDIVLLSAFSWLSQYQVGIHHRLESCGRPTIPGMYVFTALGGATKCKW